MAEPRFIDVESCGLRFKSESEARPVSRIRYDGEECEVVGWSSDGPCQAFASTVEDSSAGTAVLIHGGELGLRITPRTGAPFDETHLVLDASAILD